ncbi:MAG TPA: hypothetical protein VLJ40_11115 [Arthrobacter sp.]|nr:hypothetical protein [Arthrobacter sp.]
MGAIYTDVTELVDLVTASAAAGEEPGEVGEVIQHVHGWVAPTVSGLARRLISEVMGRTPQNDEDAKQLQRVISLLGTGT